MSHSDPLLNAEIPIERCASSNSVADSGISSTQYSEFCDDTLILGADLIPEENVEEPVASGSTIQVPEVEPDILNDSTNLATKRKAGTTAESPRPLKIIKTVSLESSKSEPPPKVTLVEPKPDVPISPPIDRAATPQQRPDKVRVPQIANPADKDCPIVIGNSKHLQNFVEKLPFGVRWEIARAVSLDADYSWFSVPLLLKLQQLGSNAAAAPEVARLLRGAPSKSDEDPFVNAFAAENAAKMPWEELDKEEALWKEDHFAGLGCNQEHPLLRESDPDWYGGKVHFIAVLKFVDGTLRLVLEPAVLGPSTRVSRRFGSWSMIRFRVSKDLIFLRSRSSSDNSSNPRALPESLHDYCCRPFVLMGSVYRAFFAKESNVFLIRTNEEWDGTRVVSPNKKPLSVRGRPAGSNSEVMTFMDFVRWHNNPELNREQTMVKWAARFALALSNSIPGYRLQAKDIRYEPEIICESFDGKGKPPSEMEMTDGCGYISRALLHKLQDRFQWENEPTAIQCRIGGAKGMFSLHPNHQHADVEGECVVWLRPSQVKIKHTHDPLTIRYLPEVVDPSQLTIDVLRSSRMSSPARLSTETIINFSENGVPAQTFVQLMQQSMTDKVSGLTTWDGPGILYKLWDNVARANNVIGQRLGRMAAGAARAKGFVFEDKDKEQDDDEDGIDTIDEAMGDRSTAWWQDSISGCPSTLEETVMVMLDSGFTPQTSPVMRAKLREVIKNVVNRFTNKYRVEIPMSCTAFIIPDPCGVLGPNEIHVKCSRRKLPDQAGVPTDLIVGDVLVTRHPCKVPTDVQKVKAVFKEELRNYVDVVVISTKGHMYNGKSLHRHLASMTGGGDYDGDTMEVYWQPEIVDQFKDADPARFAKEPAGVQECLEKDATTVAKFLDKTASHSEQRRIRAFQQYLLGPLRRDPAAVGNYSTWWEHTAYHYGYTHRTTVFLAYMFCAVLDGSKTGMTVKPDIYAKHMKDYKQLGAAPQYKETSDDRGRARNNAVPFNQQRKVARQAGLQEFVMDKMYRSFRDAANKQLSQVEQFFKSYEPKWAKLDKDLAAPWEEANLRATKQQEASCIDSFGQELALVREHVEATYDKWREARRPVNGNGSRDGAAFTNIPIEKRQDTLRLISKEFASKPDAAQLVYMSEKEMVRVRASYAYVFDQERSREGWSRFPWDVAMRTLCEIKAEAVGCTKVVMEDFYMRFAMARAFLNNT